MTKLSQATAILSSLVLMGCSVPTENEEKKDGQPELVKVVSDTLNIEKSSPFSISDTLTAPSKDSIVTTVSYLEKLLSSVIQTDTIASSDTLGTSWDTLSTKLDTIIVDTLWDTLTYNFDTFEEDIITSHSGNFTSEITSENVMFNGEAGICYKIEAIHPTNYYDVEIASVKLPNGDTLHNENFGAYDNSGESMTFVAPSSGTFTIQVEATIHIDLPRDYEYKVTVIETTIPVSVQGKWVLVSESGAALGKSFENKTTYPNTDEVLEFRGDSLFSYTFVPYGDTVHVEKSFFVDSYESNMDFSMDGDTLILTQENGENYYAASYKKYDGSIENVTWGTVTYEVPDELIGTWYLSREENSYEEYINGVEQIEELDYPYSSASESNMIYVITKNSVTRHFRHGFSASQSEYSIPKEYYFLSEAIVSGDQFTVGWAGYEETGPIDWYAGYEFETFTKYSGHTPPEEWFLVPVSEETTPLENGVTFRNDSPTKSDTIWLTFSMEAGKTYRYETLNSGCELDFTLVNDQRKQVRIFGGDGGIIAETTGEYYIACIVDFLHHSDNSERMYSITLTERS